MQHLNTRVKIQTQCPHFPECCQFYEMKLGARAEQLIVCDAHVLPSNKCLMMLGQFATVKTIISFSVPHITWWSFEALSLILQNILENEVAV